MIILGVDPGTIATGYSIIETCGEKLRLLDCGIIRNKTKTSMPQRLKLIFDTLNEVYDKFQPDEFAIETAFYGKNAQSALKLGHARGVAMLTAVSRNIPTYEYSPREVKKAIVGNGAAAKEQVRYMVKSILKLELTSKNYDITDALAVAICHHQRKQSTKTKLSANWKDFVTINSNKIISQKRKLAL